MDQLFGRGPLAPTIPQLLLQAAPTAAQGVLFPRSTGGQIGKALFQGAAGLAPLVAQNLQQQQALDVFQEFQKRQQAAQGGGQLPGLASIPSIPPSLTGTPIGVGAAQAQAQVQPEPTNFTEFFQSKSSDDQGLLLQLLQRGIPQEAFFTKPEKVAFPGPGAVPSDVFRGVPVGPQIPFRPRAPSAALTNLPDPNIPGNIISTNLVREPDTGLVVRQQPIGKSVPRFKEETRAIGESRELLIAIRKERIAIMAGDFTKVGKGSLRELRRKTAKALEGAEKFRLSGDPEVAKTLIEGYKQELDEIDDALTLGGAGGGLGFSDVFKAGAR